MSELVRVIWIGLGFGAIALGVLGIVLPLLPTTVFLLLAAYCFARSSPALHDWLVSHPTLGPPILDWRAHGAISRRAKITAIAAMVCMLAGGILFGLAAGVLIVQSLVLSAVAIFIVTRPHPPDA